ncbi:MAG: GIY-YIG nuclease family protein [Polaromonas sp.]|nr:GIY-YIG nuclease family protein [Polaromonas sp.]
METTRSTAYKLARYTILPELQTRVEEFGDEPFLLREVALPLIESHVAPEFRDVHLPFAKREGGEKFIQSVKWYVSFLAKELGLFENLSKGYFRNKTEKDIDDEVIAESALEEGDEEAGEFDGWIYAFSFPSIVKDGQTFPIKVGKTVIDVATRVMDQAKGSASFENPVVLAQWQVKRIGPTELAIHNVLKARSQWIEDAPGREWFRTTVNDIESIVNFITG